MNELAPRSMMCFPTHRMEHVVWNRSTLKRALRSAVMLINLHSEDPIISIKLILSTNPPQCLVTIPIPTVSNRMVPLRQMVGGQRHRRLHDWAPTL